MHWRYFSFLKLWSNRSNLIDSFSPNCSPEMMRMMANDDSQIAVSELSLSRSPSFSHLVMTSALSTFSALLCLPASIFSSCTAKNSAFNNGMVWGILADQILQSINQTFFYHNKNQNEKMMRIWWAQRPPTTKIFLHKALFTLKKPILT